jgi:uroporphyrinogen decarboxylase
MAPDRLKAEYGERLIFCGGAFDAVQTPPHTPAEVVYETVKENIQALARGGGYLFAGVHNIPGDTPASHLRAMLQAYRDCRTP